MKKIALFVGASLAMVAAAAPAHAGNGYVGANYVNTEIDTGIGSAEGDGWNAEGALAVGQVGGIGAEFDASFSDSDDSDSVFAGKAHVFSRTENHLIGAFVGATDGDDSTVWDFGGEGQLYLNNFTLGAAVTYATADNDGVGDVDAWGVNGQARAFINDNFSLVGNLGWANIDVDGVGEDDAIGVGAGAEYQFASLPLSLVASFNHTTFDETDVDADTWRLGVRWNFGGGTLKDRDRTGAGLADLSGTSATVLSF